MLIAAGGWLPPFGGAIFQDIIDFAAVLKRAARRYSGWRASDY